MSNLIRFSVSIDKGILDKFDRKIQREGYPTRSKAVSDLIRDDLVEQEWEEGKEVAAAIVMVYDHHKRNLSNRLTHLQHDYHELIISSSHVHLDHCNCLEIVVVRGTPGRVRELSRRLKATKGVKYCSLAAASTGSGL
ncbi:MAG: nickel-responsive transcriptional regulator NikR [Candidatus Krumholzibacteriota bacterium]|nr:nickel-responsive transcriptional regulator NikR [Candidatus Krumholzibacteriota bacterium]